MSNCRTIDEQPILTGSASSTSATPHVDMEPLGGGNPGSAVTNVVSQSAEHLGSDMHLSSLDACDRFTGKETRYVYLLLHQFHQCRDADGKMSELHATVEEMAALIALETNVMNAKHVDTNETDAQNQTDRARAPTIRRLRPGLVIDFSRSGPDGKRWNLRLQEGQMLLEE